MAPSQSNAAQVNADSATTGNDEAEIEQIMSEIEELQKSMGVPEPTPAPSVVKPDLKVVTPQPETVEEEEPEVFSLGGDASGAPLEDTLSDIPADEGPIGSGLLDDMDDIEDVNEEEVMQMAAPAVSLVSNPTTSTNPSTSGEVSLSLKGNMALKLSYDCQGNTVTVSFHEGTLHVVLGNGAEFKIPLAK